MQRNTTHAMQHPKTRKPTERPGFISRFATGTKGLVSVLGAGALLAPVDKAESATVLTGINQSGDGNVTSTLVNYAFINDDTGATYNSATLDLSPVLSYVVDSIIANNPNFDTNEEVYAGMNFNLTNAGNVSAGWSSSFDKNTGLVSITNNNRNYTEWTSASNQNTLTGTLNLGNMLDYNGNGIIDPNETLAFMGIANNAFTGTMNINNSYDANVNMLGVIPEPSSALLLGAGLGALALRRRREPSETQYTQK